MKGSADQAQRELRAGVRLRQDGRGRLLQDRVARQVRRFHGDVDVADPALRGGEVLAGAEDRVQPAACTLRKT